jgi:hypothetical protein
MVKNTISGYHQRAGARKCPSSISNRLHQDTSNGSWFGKDSCIEALVNRSRFDRGAFPTTRRHCTHYSTQVSASFADMASAAAIPADTSCPPPRQQWHCRPERGHNRRTDGLSHDDRSKTVNRKNEERWRLSARPPCLQLCIILSLTS